jgi:hypothetical protein
MRHSYFHRYDALRYRFIAAVAAMLRSLLASLLVVVVAVVVVVVVVGADVARASRRRFLLRQQRHNIALCNERLFLIWLLFTRRISPPSCVRVVVQFVN